MSLMNATCCCDCIETGAMCIEFATQDYEPGCYEFFTLQQAEEEGGIWLGAGTSCIDVSGTGCPGCVAGGSYLNQIASTREKCCYKERIKTGCNEYSIDDCANYLTIFTTKCECEMREGIWGVLGDCPCVHENTGCTGCCPETTLDPNFTGQIVVIESVLIRESYKIDWGSLAPGCGQYPNPDGVCSLIVYEETYNEATRRMSASQYPAYLAALNTNDYHIICNTPVSCSVYFLQPYYYYANLLRKTSVEKIYYSPCDCESTGLCPSSGFPCPQYYSSTYSQSGTNCICEPIVYNEGFEGMLCN
jgi:hypothetical protein